MDGHEHWNYGTTMIPPLQEQYTSDMNQTIACPEMQPFSMTQSCAPPQQQFQAWRLSDRSYQEQLQPFHMSHFYPECVPQAQQWQYPTSNPTQQTYQAQHMESQLQGIPWVDNNLRYDCSSEQAGLGWFLGCDTQTLESDAGGMLFTSQHVDNLHTTFAQTGDMRMMGGSSVNNNNCFTPAGMFETSRLQHVPEPSNDSNFAHDPQNSYRLPNDWLIHTGGLSAPMIAPRSFIQKPERKSLEQLNDTRKRRRCVRRNLPRELTHNDNMVPPTKFERYCAIASQAARMKGCKRSQRGSLTKYFRKAYTHVASPKTEQKLLDSEDKVLFELLSNGVS